MADRFLVAALPSIDDDDAIDAVEAAAAQQAPLVEAVEVLSPHLRAADEPGARDMFVAAAALVAGVVGGVGAYLVQWWTSTSSTFPVNAGDRPLHAAPAFIPLTFESTVLFAAAAAVAAFLFRARLPRLAHPIFDVPHLEHASVDRVFVVLRVRDGADEQRLFADLRAAGVVDVTSSEVAP